MRSTKPLASTPVLRDIVVQDLPHALSRPRRSVATPGIVPAAVQEPHFPAPKTFDEGFAEGYREGITAGRKAHLAENEASLEELRRRAFDEGRADGMRRGKEEAADAVRKLQAQLIDEGRAALAAQTERLEKLLRALNAQSQTLAANAEDDLVAMSFEVVCRILGNRAATPDAIRGMVEHLLAQRARAGLVIHVNPDDFEHLAESPGWTWVADEKVELGGVVLRSAQGSLDGRLEVQLEALRQTLLQVRVARKASTASNK